MKIPAGQHVVIGLVIVVVVVAVVSGLVLLGPPTEGRTRRLDDRRVDNLREITRALDFYWTRHARLAASLDELSREPGVSLNSRDPTTAELYDYRVLGATTYELCAHFQRDSAEGSQGLGKDFWSHGAGRQCFQLEARDIRR